MDARFITPTRLALITTHQCTAACDHCCFACSPRITRRIPGVRLRELIGEAVAIPSIRYVCFTGGECFLLGDELIDLLAHSRDLGFRTVCMTNGYWAVNPRAASRMVERLAGVGTGYIAFSTGEMHARFVPPERVINGVAAACDAGIEVQLRIEDFHRTSFDWRSVCEHPEIKRRTGLPNLEVRTTRWIPNAEGKGKASLRHLRKHDRLRQRRPARCANVMDTITVNPSLDLIACCGLPMESIPELRLNSVRDKTLEEALREAPFDPLKLWLHVAGPERMLHFVKRYLPDFVLPQSAQICQTCTYLHKDAQVVKVLRDHFHEIEDELIREYLRLRRVARAS